MLKILAYFTSDEHARIIHEMTSCFRRFITLFTIAMAMQGTPLIPAAAASEVENPIFGYTHLLPSPFTLPAGTLVYGTSLDLGVTDFLQIGTNVLSDFHKIYNANAKVSLVDYPEFAFGLTLGYSTYNYRDIDRSNPDLSVASWLPGAVAAFEVLPSVAWFVGGNLNYTQANLISDSVTTSGYLRGANVESDLSWAYNPQKKRKNGGLSVGNVVSAGISYDLSYKMLGLGLSHHWPGFHLGVHYYPSAAEYPLQPILAGGGAVQF
ncbi:MAG TPA: hypothetical protein VJB59_02060 [Bdellovibrionota bacterium]|nr:hypothetical protein [Bdellovibrionota bacterium]